MPSESVENESKVRLKSYEVEHTMNTILIYFSLSKTYMYVLVSALKINLDCLLIVVQLYICGYILS